MWQGIDAVGGGDTFPPPPVHRGSQLAGACEGDLWAPTTRQQVQRIVAAAERLDRATKQPGRGGILGRPALAVLRALAEVIDHGTGRLCPSWAWLEARTGYSRDSVWRALRRLHQAGLVAWIGRYQPTGLGRERGPQVAQTSSAYALRLPPELAAIVATMPSTEALAREAAQRRQEARAGRLASWREARERRAAEVAARVAAVRPAEVARQTPSGIEADRARFASLLSAIRFDRPRQGKPPD
jgi:ribosome modulation factor